MKQQRLIPLAALTAALLFAAIYVSYRAAPQTDVDAALLLPELKPRINDIDRLQIRGGGETVTIARQGGVWVIAEMGDYPALFDKVKHTVLAAAELKLLEEKTANAALYHRLGVQDIDADNGGDHSHLLTLSAADADIAALIVGKRRHSSSPSDQPGLYARRPDGGPALLAAGRLEVTSRASEWFEREILNIDSDTVRRLELRPRGKAAVLLIREEKDADLTLAQAPEGKTAQAAAVLNQAAALLQGVYAEAARREADLQDASKVSKFHVVTFDGLRIDGELVRRDEKSFALFAASAAAPEPDGDDEADTDAAAQQAEELNRRLDGWGYELSQHKADLMSKTMDDFAR